MMGVKIGDTIIIKRRQKPLGPGLPCEFHDEEWDVIKVNKKSIVLQNYPTYETKRIKR